MATNYITKEYLIKQLQGFADKLATIYEKQENIQFKVIDKYSDLTEPKVSTICYILNAETIDVNVYEKGFYLYNINNTIPTWQYISVGGSDFELNPWQPSFNYEIGDFCYIDKGLYICLTQHTSDIVFDETLWELIVGGSNFKIDEWEQNKQYEIDNVVYINYKLYKCISQHLSTINFEDDIINWKHIVGSDEFTLDKWQESTDYKLDKLVVYDNKIYKCLVEHTSSIDFITDKTKWELLVGSADFELNEWQPETDYVTNKIIYKDLKAYKCLVDHTSTTNFEDDLLLDNWVCIIGSNAEEVPVWETNKIYNIGDKVKESGIIYESIKDHTSTIFVDDKDNWVQVSKEYICCTKDQYDYLAENDLLKGMLYIVEGIDEEEPVSSADNGGSATLTQDIVANITVGNITEGYVFKAGMTFDEYVKAVHVSHLAPIVNLTLNPSATIYRKGDVIDTLDVIATITKKSSDIDNIRYYVGGVLVDTKDNTTDSGLANGGIYIYKYENTITDNTEIKVIVNDGKTNITKTTKIEFVNPIYIGLSSDTTLTSVLQNKGTYVYRDITCTDESVIFKYPKSYGELTSIKDSNGFENLDSFTQTIEEIHGEDYYVYTNEPSTLDGFTYTFTF